MTLPASPAARARAGTVCERLHKSATNRKEGGAKPRQQAHHETSNNTLALRERDMQIRFVCVSLCLMVGAPTAWSASGLQPPAAEQVWPQWQARVALSSQPPLNAPLAQALSLVRQADLPTAPLSLQGASLVGDYYLTAPSANGLLSGLRASGGVLLGSNTTALVASAHAAKAGSARWRVASGGGLATGTAPAEPSPAATYLGLGFSGAAWRSSLAFSADLGLLAERPAGAVNAGRALLGNQGLENALREFRLSPLFQLGVRYTF
jgi:hypothetical protein